MNKAAQSNILVKFFVSFTIDFHLLYFFFALKNKFSAISPLQVETDPAQLLPQLLDRLIELGDMARQLNQALGGNGHRPEQAAELIQQLVNERR